MKNHFITFEGGEGSGKSTQIKLLNNFLVQKKANVLCTREPGGTPSAEIIRKLVTQGDVDRWSPMTESLLMWAARSELVDKLIKPSLQDGKWVLCDRFYHSTFAYQGLGHNLGLENMKLMKSIVIGDLDPDFIIVLDIDPVKGIERTKNRNSEEDRFEKLDIEFHKLLRGAFLSFAEEEPEQFLVIDAELDVNSISRIICDEVSKRFNL